MKSLLMSTVWIIAGCSILSAVAPGEFGQTGSEDLSLNGQWQFSISEELSDTKDWTKPEYDCSGWDQLPVPGNWDVENAYAHFKGTGYYRKHFTVPAGWEGSVVRLHFGAVYQHAHVWMNGRYLGEHVGGYTPFEFTVTDIVQFGGENVVALSANNEYGRGAWWHWGGISREVRLIRNNNQHIVWQHVTTEPDLENGTAEITASVKVRNHSGQPFSGALNAVIREAGGERAVAGTLSQTISIPAGSEGTATLSFFLEKQQVRLWNVNSPNLYRLDTRLMEACSNDLVHSASDRFGIRKIEIRDARLLLNGEVIRLNGFNRVADHRAYGQTEPDHLVKFDIDAMKAMGCNFTRIMHYPQAPSLLDYCDEVGMLLIEEIPVWGKGDPQLQPDNPVTKQWLSEMIERDFNHPSIIGWSVGNEIADGSVEGRKMSPQVYGYVESMIDHVQSLDPTRLKTYVSFTVGGASELGTDPADVCDIVCFNVYGGAAGLARKCHALWPDKPIFVSEIGGSQLGSEPEESTLGEALIKHIKQLEDLEYVVGSSLWTYNDYRSSYRNTPADENRSWGVYTVWRQPKKAAEQIRELYASGRSGSLPSMDNRTALRSKGAPTIRTVVPLENSCMVGFSVDDGNDAYEIEYTAEGGSPSVVRIEGLQGAAKLYRLEPASYSIRIRTVSDSSVGAWSEPCTVTISSNLIGDRRVWPQSE